MKKNNLKRLTVNRIMKDSKGNKVRIQYKITHNKTRRNTIQFSTITSKRKPIINTYHLRFRPYNIYFGTWTTVKSWSNYRHRGSNGRSYKMHRIKRFNPNNLLPY